jgi:hypothetical protein
MKHALFGILLGSTVMAVWMPRAMAQADDQSPAARALNGDSGPGNAGVPNGSGGDIGRRGHGRSNAGTDSGPGEMPALKPLVTPRQRLDTGALYCHTEAQLRQHQAAIMARIAGRTAPEPGGCHIVGETIPVSIVQRDGQAATEIQMAGDEPQIAWTDAVIRDSDPMHSPMK